MTTLERSRSLEIPSILPKETVRAGVGFLRWPIRNQILLPLLVIYGLVSIAVSTLAVGVALSNVEREFVQRIDDVAESIEEAKFPLIPAVLSQLQHLTGAEFVVFQRNGDIEASTFDDVPAMLRSLVHDSEFSEVMETSEYLLRQVRTSVSGTDRHVLIAFPTSLLQATRRNAILVPLLMGLASYALTVIAVLFVSRKIGQRIQRIEQQVARVARGDFEPIPLGTTDDELRDLAISANQMCAELQSLTRRTRESERGLLIRQFAGGIAHQLRNGITGARLTLQLHQKRCSLQDESLSVALRQFSLTEEQVRGLVDLIREQPMARQPADLRHVVDEVAALIAPISEHRGVSFQGDVDFRVKGWTADGQRLRTALLNLCLNGIEACRGPGQRVELLGKRLHDTVAFEVRDTGPGLSDEIRERAFDPFQTTKPDGMGLGLAIVKTTAEELGGEIQYERANGMTIFRLILPVGNAPPDDAQPLASAEESAS